MVMKTIPTLHPILRTTPHGMTKKKRNEKDNNIYISDRHSHLLTGKGDSTA